MSVNKVILLGNLGQDPELHTEEKAWCRFSIATTDYKKETTWHNVVAFGKQAEVISKYCHKGDSLYVEGRIKRGEYKDKPTFTVIVGDFSLVGGRKKEEPDKDLPF